jgi:hypothetical protein
MVSQYHFRAISEVPNSDPWEASHRQGWLAWRSNYPQRLAAAQIEGDDMPTVTIARPVTIQDTAEALQQALGDRYEITTHGHGAQEALKVKQSAAALATVHLDQDSNTTTFHIHGGGLVISRMINEFGIAKKVAAAIQEALRPTTNLNYTPAN